MAGVLEAKLLSWCLFSSGLCSTDLCHSMRPLGRSRHSSTRSAAPRRHEARKIRSSQTTGEAWPAAGNGRFPGDAAARRAPSQSVGKPVSCEEPSARGPRQPGQFSPRHVAPPQPSQAMPPATNRPDSTRQPRSMQAPQSGPDGPAQQYAAAAGRCTESPCATRFQDSLTTLTSAAPRQGPGPAAARRRGLFRADEKAV